MMSLLSKPFILAVLLLLGFLAPELAHAAGVVSPPGGKTHWDLMVYGNGRVIQNVLEGVKLLMVPDHGNSGYGTLMLVLATLGFLTMAIAAGFDPSKNLIRMFTYIIAVWAVSYASTSLTANVVIIDLASNGTTASDYPIERVPALVAMPAVLTSAIGNYFTKSLETNFSIPDAMKMGPGGSVGQFNLFGRMMQEANQFVITSSELKRSLSAYTADCVVPALALGQYKAYVTVNGAPEYAYGTEALLRPNNMLEGLGSAGSPSIFTKYFPYSADSGWEGLTSFVPPPALETDQPADSTPIATYKANGILTSCAGAYAAIKADMENHANALVAANGTAWEKAGVMVPFEAAFTQALGMIAAPGNVKSYTAPNSFILQQAMINSSNGSFRQAAIQTGNNELMQATAIAQAEQQQKSAWASSFAVFNNMMGYVFTVLQAFIFAITPLIIMAFVVPGLGKPIFVNYAQILVWMMLWQPMLCVINFVITLFGADSISSAVAQGGGLNGSNAALISEKTNDLIVASQFLGTMTPLLSWGIVKGAMAFTEFISAGVGSQFANAAGASAALGNVSMNNMSMNNTGMNSYSTMASSAVGQQAPTVSMGTGSLTGKQDAGGSAVTMNGQNAGASKSIGEDLNRTQSHLAEVSKATSAMVSEGFTMSQLENMATSLTKGSAKQQAAQDVLNIARQSGESSGTGKSVSTTDSAGTGKNASFNESNSEQSQASFGGGIKGAAGVGTPKGGPASAGLNLNLGGSLDSSNTNAVSEQGSRTGQEGKAANRQESAELEKRTYSESTGASASRTNSNSQSEGRDFKMGNTKDSSSQLGRAAQEALSRTERLSEQVSAAQKVSSSVTLPQGSSIASMQNNIAQLEAMSKNLGMENFKQNLAAMEHEADSMRAGHQALRTGFDARNGAKVDAGARAAQSFGPSGGVPAVPASPTIDSAQQGIKDQHQVVTNAAEKIESHADSVVKKAPEVSGDGSSHLKRRTPGNGDKDAGPTTGEFFKSLF
jgi:hypothetical protein